MEILIKIELQRGDLERVKTNSIERVLNNAIRVGQAGETELKSEVDRENASILWQDAEELKSFTSRLWNAFREATWQLPK